ncbi:MAG TPA: metal ABC transporter substrate-binding protein [Spirochaetota bacterium]|nr:metal ABC transporter substrate-binding protein [Spirochaetota bacterium]
MKAKPPRLLHAAAALTAVLALVVIVSCARQEGTKSGELLIAVSIYPVCDIARSIAGDRADVFFAVPPGANPHTFEPLPSTVKRLQASQIFIGIHPEYDGWVEKYLRKGTVVSYLMDRGSHDNPHIWLSIDGGRRIARHINARLSEIDPDGAEYFRKNLLSYDKELAELDRRIAILIRPLHGKKLIQWHPSWDYFAADYGLLIIDTIEKGHGHEPSVRDFNRLVQKARSERVRVVVIDLKVHSGAATALARETGAVLLQLDSLGDPGDPDKSNYPRMMEHNARLLAKALTGDVLGGR